MSCCGVECRAAWWAACQWESRSDVRSMGGPMRFRTYFLLFQEDTMLKKPRPRLLMLSFSALALLLLLLSACGGTTPTTGSTPTTGGNAVKGGTWVDDLIEEPDSLIPNASSETFSAMVDFALWAPLVYGTPQGQLQAG